MTPRAVLFVCWRHIVFHLLILVVSFLTTTSSDINLHRRRRSISHYISQMFAAQASGVSDDSSPSSPSNELPLLPPIPLSYPLIPPLPLSPSSSDLPNLTPPPPINPVVYSLLSRPVCELLVRPKGHILAYVDLLSQCFAPSTTEYDCADLFPSPRWLQDRHRNSPAVFRDTFSNFRYWTEGQQEAIRGYFNGWDTDEKHPLHSMKGSLISSSESTRTPPIKQKDLFQHSMAYYLDHLHRRHNKSLGMIIYGIDIRKSRKVQSFRYGPQGCDFYQCDAYKASAPLDVEIVVVAGMKNTWSSPHIDPGGDSTWTMELEGSKLWVLARPEVSTAFMNHFNRPVVWKQWTKEDRKFLIDNKCLMILQRPGDIIYVPHGWPHMVKHLSDTLAFNSSVLNGWDVTAGIGGMDFGTWDDQERDMFMDVKRFVQKGHERIGMTFGDVKRLNEVWEQKNEERRAKRHRIDEE
jgi:hypothetical protein